MSPKYRRWPFKRQAHKVVKHTQTIRRLLPTSCLSVFDHFVGLALKGFSDQGWQLKRLSESSLLILKI